MATLTGEPRPVDLGQGVTITAPGLRGEAVVHDVSPAAPTRSTDVDGSDAALQEALDETGIRPVRVITLDVAQQPAFADDPASTDRGPSDTADGIVLDVPDLGAEVALVVMATDENGVVTFTYPVGSPAEGPPAAVAADASPVTRGAAATVRFVLPGTLPPIAEPGGDRGVLGYLGRKVLEVLAVPLGAWALQPVARLAAAHWEGKHRKVRVRRYDSDSYQTNDVTDLDADGWTALARGRSLWFVHGTFSSAVGGFGGLSRATLDELHRRYEGRVVAFDHHTLAVDPLDNVKTLAGLVPDGLRIEADIVAHSRGGLVARELAAPGSPITVRRSVFVGTPNHGTALADPQHLKELLSRIATMLNLTPSGPVSVIADSMSVVLTVVAIVAQYGLPALPGLAAMDPRGEYLRVLNAAAPPDAVGYAVAAEYEPPSTATVKARLRDTVTDSIFAAAANDLVVPTLGVYDVGTGATFAVPEDRRLVIAAARGVDHSSFFVQTDVADALLRWLTE